MMRQFYLLCAVLVLPLLINAQDVTVIDYESTTTNATFQYFGSSLEPGMNQIIANPDATGINTSDSVGQFIKPTGAQTWAGGFALLADSLDLTTNSQICMKVWFNNPGNVLLKLEEGSLGIWEQQLSVTTTGEWTELCFNTELNGPSAPASGGKYAKLVLFFDFGTVPTEDQTFYFDDIITTEGSADPVDVTFQVNMNDYTGTIANGMFLGGTFNGWSDTETPMTDADNDGIWEATLSLVPGAIEYKFIVDNWGTSEQLEGHLDCVEEFDGGFVNRVYTVAEAVTMPVVCYESCYNCGDAVTITVNLGAGDTQISEDGFFMAGGGNFGNPGDNPFTDNGDGTYTVKFEKPVNFTSNYTFTNGNCPDWSCKEDIAGQSCADADNWNDRKMENVTSDTVINTCFAVCVDTVCAGNPPVTHAVEFSVDMTPYAGTFTQVYVSGTINGWSGEANPLTEVGEGIWEGTVDVVEGMHEYKFTMDNWTVQEQFEEGAECTVTNGGFTNRSIDVTEDMAVCFLFDSCATCALSGLHTLEGMDVEFSINPTMARDMVFVNVQSQTNLGNYSLILTNANGQVVRTMAQNGNLSNFEMNVSNLATGLYNLSIQTATGIATQRFVVQR